MNAEQERLYKMFQDLIGVYTEPIRGVESCNNIPDCPIMGSGKVAVAVEGDYSSQTFYISKTDFWYAGGKNVFDYESGTAKPEYPPYTIQPAALGGLSIHIGEGSSEKNSAFRYCQEQDLFLAEIRSELPTENDGGFSICSFAPHQSNYIFLELRSSEVPVSVKAELWVHEEETLKTDAGIRKDVLWCQSCYEGIWNVEAAMAARMFGASELHFKKDSSGRTTAEFWVVPEQPVWIGIAIAGGKECRNSREKAADMISDINGEIIQQLKTDHRRAWEDYWHRSYVFFDDRDLERFYYGALYELACITDVEGHVPPGIAGGWIHNANPLWSGNYTMNYNAQAPFWGVYSSNRPELGMPFIRLVMDYLEEGKKLAVEKGTKGVLIPVHINPWGSCDLRDPVCQKSNASLAAVNFIWQYEFTQDQDFLTHTAYPYIKECAEFWEDNVCRDENGSYIVWETAERERWPGDRNSNNDLAHVRKVLTAAVQWSKKLGIDEEKRPLWNQILDNLSDYPIMVYDKKTVFKEAENRNQMSFFGQGDNPVNLDHIYPMEAIEMQHSKKLAMIAKNTIEQMNSWNQANAFPRIFSQAVRAGWPGEDILRRFKERIHQNLYPSETLRRNQTIVPQCHGLEAVGAIEFLNSMLVQAYDQTIRLFPVWPRKKDVSFRNLCTRGAFLVSAAMKEEEISEVEIFSQNGGRCELILPWTGRKIVVNEVLPETKRSVEIECCGEKAAWDTQKGGRYLVIPTTEELKDKGKKEKLSVPVLITPIIRQEDQPTEGQGDGAIDIVLSPEKKSTSITADVYMSGGEILRNYQQWEWINHNPEVVQTGRNGQITGVGSGEAKLTVYAELNGESVSSQITVFVMNQRILDDVAIEAGAGYDGWAHPFPLMWNAECVVRGLGLSCPDMTAKKRGNPYGFGMWLTPENPGKDAWIIFDLKEIYSLDEMWIWNYNCWDDEEEKHIWGYGTGCGIKQVQIFYSQDKENWNELKSEGYPYKLKKAENERFLKATNLDNKEGSPIKFHGIKARFVKIAADERIGIGNWGGLRYGLSAVRFSVKPD